MNLSVSFRVAEVGDLDPILAMMRKLYRHEELPFDIGRISRATLTLLANSEQGIIWTIEQQDERAGYLVLTWGFSIEFGGPFGLLDELFLLEEHRGKGIGTQAIEFAFAECRRRNIQAVRVEVTHENKKAMRLYNSLGFDELQRSFLTKRL